MTGALYLRRARLEIGNVGIPVEPDTGLRLTFKIHKNPLSNHPNQAQIAISNLNKRSRDDVTGAIDPTFVGPQAPGLTPVRLFAGYKGLSGMPGSMGLIFSGHVVNGINTREGADWETRILAEDGAITNDVRVTKTYPAGTAFKAILTDLVGSIKSSLQGVDVSQALKRIQQGTSSGGLAGGLSAALDIVFAKPLAVDGSVMDKINGWLRPKGFEISQQDGAIILLQIGETLPGLALKLNAQTGLVGTLTPVRDDQLPGAHLFKGRSLLRHEMQIGSAIFIDSEVSKGYFKVRKLEFEGDTHGPSWYCDFEILSVDNLTPTATSPALTSLPGAAPQIIPPQI